MKWPTLAWLLLLPLNGAAEERLLEFHSDILVRTDGMLEVAETVRVRAEGDQIRRGIYRDFPTRYKDRFGNEVNVIYKPQSVMRDDRTEPFHTERRDNGVRTYFGSTERMLEPGVHTYRYRYIAGRVLGYFAERDELYWNVTGLGWAFPIDAASATVSFEQAVDGANLGVEAYTGPGGAKGREYRAHVEGQSAHFATTRPLLPGEGLTIVVNWPKGLIDEPGAGKRLWWLVSDNRDLLTVLAGLLLLLAYYVPVWRRFGRDPEPGITVTRYEPPQGFSPASLRYVRRMGFDNKVMTAAIVNLAVKGYLQIEIEKKKHVLRKKPSAHTSATPLAEGERELLEALFADSDELILDDKYHERISRARSAHQRMLSNRYRNRYFRINGLMNLPALLIVFLTSFAGLSIGRGPKLSVFLVILAMLLATALFVVLMRRPTFAGRKLLDETEGFQDYLEIAEKDEMNLRNPPEKTPQLFEAYLPYALALGVEQAWAERFTKVFASLRDPDGGSYHPAWYTGSWNSLASATSSARLTSNLDSAISSSVTPPGSSSGSGGGGSSGGGGGGGGGGGW